MKIMTAKYKGKCYACDVWIKVGEAIEFHGAITGSKHVDCPAAVGQQTVADKRASQSITQLGDFGDVYALFVIAASGGKWPRITINADGYEFYLYVSGEQAMIPGVINVKTPHDGWYGRITLDGAWDQRHKVVDERMADALSRLAMDPVGTVAMYGRTSGKCCFCKKQLTDAPSVDAGYGPVCAKRWGLSWGGGKLLQTVPTEAQIEEMISNTNEQAAWEASEAYYQQDLPPCDYCAGTGKVANTEPGGDDVVCMGCVGWCPDAKPIDHPASEPIDFPKLSDVVKADAAAPKETVTLKTKEIIAEVKVTGFPGVDIP